VKKNALVLARLGSARLAAWCAVDVVLGDVLPDEQVAVPTSTTPSTTRVLRRPSAGVLPLPPAPDPRRLAHVILRASRSVYAEIPDELIVAVAVACEHLRILAPFSRAVARCDGFPSLRFFRFRILGVIDLRVRGVRSVATARTIFNSQRSCPGRGRDCGLTNARLYESRAGVARRKMRTIANRARNDFLAKTVSPPHELRTGP